MKLKNLTEEEINIILEVLKPFAEGYFIEDGIFRTLLNFERNDIKNIIKNWDLFDDEDESVRSIIDLSLNAMIYFNDNYENWSKFIPISLEQVDDIYFKWLGKTPNKEKWDGVIRGVMTSTSRKIWDQLPKNEKNNIFKNVWCSNCRMKTTVTNYEGCLDIDGNINILGSCVECGKNIELSVKINK